MADIITLRRTHTPIQSNQDDTTDRDIIQLHSAATNALTMALHALRKPGGSSVDLQRATVKAIRAATTLKRLCSAQAEGGAA